MCNLHNDMYTVVLTPVYDRQPLGLTLLFPPQG